MYAWPACPHVCNPHQTTQHRAYPWCLWHAAAYHCFLSLCVSYRWISRGATQALKIVGEMFPWSPSPGWRPGRRVSPGGGDDQEAGRVSDCGHVPVTELSGEASTFVYLRKASSSNVLRHHTPCLLCSCGFNGGLLLGLLGNTSMHHDACICKHGRVAAHQPVACGPTMCLTHYYLATMHALCSAKASRMCCALCVYADK